MTDTEIQRFRQETPGCADVTHFNNAGAALPPDPVMQAIREHLELEARIGGYEAAAARRDRSQGFFTAVAELLNAQPHQIAFTGSATESYNRALSSIRFSAGDVILTTKQDYVSNQIAFFQLKKLFGVEVVRIADHPLGGFDLEDLARCIDQYQPKLVAITHIPTNTGLIQEVEAAGRLCREAGCWYLVDACQSAGQLPLDVQAIGCDFLSATFRKFMRGPRGSGFLYVSDRVLEAGLEPHFLDLHSADWTGDNAYSISPDARRFELWERPHALVHGAAAAARYATEIGLDRIAQRVQALATELRQQLSELEGVQVLDKGAALGGMVTCHIEDQVPEELLQRLRKISIHGSIVDYHSARLDFDEKGVRWALRLSPHYYNTNEEIEKVTKEIFKIICW